MEREIQFLGWLDPNHLWARVKVYDTVIIVPRSRLIPHPLCQWEAESRGIHDPNAIVDYCAEKSSLFAIPVFRHWMHLMKTRDPMSPEEQEKAYPLPPRTDFSCIRECILRGGDTDICIAQCTGW